MASPGTGRTTSTDAHSGEGHRRIRIVLQARTSSSRLPGKVLLPICGFPLATLCAARLSRLGHDLVLATSDDPSDDELAGKAMDAGFVVFRGSLENVLKRFVDTTADLNEDDIIVRATADNPVPDADFVALMLERFCRRIDCDYLGLHSNSGLPHGLSAELVRVRALRSAVSSKRTDLEVEHVTPWVRDNLSCEYLTRQAFDMEANLSRLRCTIDTAEDYRRAVRLFESAGEDPRVVGWRTLIAKLSGID